MAHCVHTFLYDVEDTAGRLFAQKTSQLFGAFLQLTGTFAGPVVVVKESRMPRSIITPEIGEAIKVAHAANIPLREFARNRRLNENTVLSYARRKGLTQEIQTATAEARGAMHSGSRTDELTNVQSVRTTMVQRGQRYVGRMMDISEKVVPYLEKMKPAKFITDIHEIKKFDDMTRRHAGLSDTAGLGGSLSIEVLTNQAAVRVTAQA